MVKNLFLSVSVLGYFLFRLFFPDGLTLTPKYPENVNAGDEFTYELTVSKPGISGFAKIQQELPEGFTAEQIETKGASFSSAGGVVKFIWMSLPSEDEFTISYKVKVDPSASGSAEITGKFSFLENNVKSSKEIPTSSITIGGGATASTEETSSSDDRGEDSSGEETMASNDEGSDDNATTEEVTPSTDSETNSVASSNVRSSRKITKEGAGKYKVTINIINDGLTGFAKAQDVLPEGALAYQDNANSSVFSFSNKKVKFVWMSLPTDKNIEISYIIATNNVEDIKNISGEFTYLDNNETKRVVTNTVAMPSSDEMVSSGGTTTNPGGGTTTSSGGGTTTSEGGANRGGTTSSGGGVNTTTTSGGGSTTASGGNTSGGGGSTTTTSSGGGTTSSGGGATASSKGVQYKVQIMANKKRLNDVPNYFQKTYGFTEEGINVENHEGWIKYTIGKFDQYKGARDRRNQVTSGYNFPGPFVTAYVDGKRTTVQDALMVSRDKWYP